MIVRVVSKYLLSSSRTSSGSRDSDSVVKPTRSTNRTDTCRFSDCDGPGCAGSATGPGDMAASGAAHWAQNRCSAPTSAPHDGHWRARGAAHWPQNRLPPELSEPQAPHLTAAPPSPERTDQVLHGGADARLRAGAPMFSFCQRMSASACCKDRPGAHRLVKSRRVSCRVDAPRRVLWPRRPLLETGRLGRGAIPD